jgi:hypothetical protein
MMIRRFLAVSALSLSVSAFLVVPSIPVPIETAAVAENPEVLPFDRIGAQARHLRLPCLQCPFAETSDDGQVKLLEGIESALVSLLISLSIEQQFLWIVASYHFITIAGTLGTLY